MFFFTPVTVTPFIIGIVNNSILLRNYPRGPTRFCPLPPNHPKHLGVLGELGVGRGDGEARSSGGATFLEPSAALGAESSMAFVAAA